ncbi:MAG: amidohydrolase family protein [Planctomycetes bacterium]|nr:amidohydrolase family protein [Planctomycetota bacterium]MCP4771545.1 amidohydrolase family protein [Planctomycetota bacterium]MCP4861206.1 amidohydrolase family protein [Planctomycetota bacterium]
MKPARLLIAGIGGVALLAAATLYGDADPRPEGPAPLVLTGEGAATAYHAAEIHTASKQGVVKDGYLVIQDGKVAAVLDSAESLPAMLPIVELGSAHLAPGLVAADSTVAGTYGEGDRSMAAHMLAVDSFDPWANTAKLLERGITTYYLSPDRSRLIGGRGAVVKAGGEKRMLLEQGDLRVNLTPSAWNPPDYFRPPMPPTAENPLLPAIDQAPNSRPGAMRALRSTWAALEEEGIEADLHLQGLQAYRASDAPLRIVVDTADEAASALQLAATWGRRVVLDGLSQADRSELKEVLADSRAIVLMEVPLFSSMPELNRDWQAPASDQMAGLTDDAMVALRPGRYGRWTWLMEAASKAVGTGLSERAALRGITAVPARLLGVGRRVGSLKPGLDADFLVLDSAPLDPACSVSTVYIEGAQVWSRSAVSNLETNAVVVRAGTLWTGEGAPLEGGVEVLMQDGRIIAAGRSVPYPAGVRVVDAGADAHITPGFIDSRGFLGSGGARRINDRVDLGAISDGSYFSEMWRPVAQAGITSMVLGQNSFASAGSRASIVKTAVAEGTSGSLADHNVVFFDIRSSDHLAAKGGLARQLKTGKGYADKWTKYREERAKWEGEQAAKGSDERASRERDLRIRLAQGSAPAVEEEVVEEEEEEVVEEEEVEATPVDPINGLWEGTIEHEMLPEPVAINVRLHHEGKRVTAILSSPDDPSGETFETEGTWENDTIHIEIPTEVGNVMIDGILDAPDSMSVKIELAGMGSVEFTMARTEIEEAGAAPVARKKVKVDAGPQPPTTSWQLEGMRALYEGRAVAVVAASRRDEITEAIHMFAEAGIPMHLMYADEALDVASVLRENGTGVLVSPTVTQREDNRDYVPAAELGAAGIPVAFQSNAVIGARFLPSVLTMATRYGLGSEQALAGLTSDAADMLGIADRVGRVQAGLDGDLVVFNGHPFDLRTSVSTVFVNGREVPQE